MSQPTYSSATGYTSEQFFTMYFDVALDATHPPLASAFALQINGTGTAVTGVTVDSAAKTVTLTFSASALTPGDIIEFSYTDPTVGNDVNAIQGTDGADAAMFSSSTIVFGARPGPSAPATPTLASASDSGAPGDGITNHNIPTLTGTAAASATVKLYDTDGTTLLGTTTADGSGNWSITSSTLADGSHTLKVTQTDSGNNTSPLSAGLALTIDTVAAAPTALALAAGSDSGALGDGITNVGTPVVTGHAEANATVRLYDTDGTTVLGTATADGAGNWSVTSINLTEGVHTLTAKQTDVAGNVSVASSPFTYTHDTVGPAGMALSTTSVAQTAAANGATIATLSATDLTSVTYGFAVGNGTIDADNGKFTISGNSLVAAQSLTAGTYHIYLNATDAAGNEAFQIFAINVTNGPGVGSIVRTGAAAATAAASATTISYTVTFSEAVTGVDSSDFALTASGTAAGTIAGVTGSGSTYTVTVNGVSGNGTLRLDLNSSGTGILNAGSEAITGGYTAGQTFTIDHTLPAAPSIPVMSAGTDTGASASDAITSNATPVFTGVSEANATVRLYDSNGTTVLGTTAADGAGNWSITSSTLSSGIHTLTAKAVDAAGNVSLASGILTAVIATGAAAPGALSLAAGSDSGTPGDGITNIGTPTIKGSGSVGATVTIYDTDGSTVLGTAVVDGTGHWSTTSLTLGTGSHTLTAKQTDLAGNVSPASAALALTIDTTAPAAPTALVLAGGSDSGTVGDGITNIASPVIRGSAEAGATVVLHDSNGTTVLGTATADGAGNWSIASGTLALGAHTLSATQTDVAGNISTASATLTLSIIAAPVVPPTLVDGVPVTTAPVTLPGGGSGSIVSVPIVAAGAGSVTGPANLADIPLSSANGATLLLAQVPVGSGLTATAGASQPAGSSLAELIAAIEARTTTHTAADQAHLTGNGQQFLGLLDAAVPLLVSTLQLQDNGAAATVPLTLTGSSSSTQHTALVIDASALAAGSSIVLHAVDFAAVVGAATVTADTAGQIITGDLASQHVIAAASGATQIYAGGGDDNLQYAPPAAAVATALHAVHVTALASTSAELGAPTAVYLDGGTGNDTATFAKAQSAYTVDQHDGYVLVTDNASPANAVTLTNVEHLAFADATVAVSSRAELTTIAGLYESVLGRQPEIAGFDFWGALQSSGRLTMGDIALGFIDSPEAAKLGIGTNGDATHDVTMLYKAIFNRAPDAAGLAFWVNAIHQGETLSQVANAFVTAPEIVGHQLAVTAWDLHF